MVDACRLTLWQGHRSRVILQTSTTNTVAENDETVLSPTCDELLLQLTSAQRRIAELESVNEALRRGTEQIARAEGSDTILESFLREARSAHQLSLWCHRGLHRGYRVFAAVDHRLHARRNGEMLALHEFSRCFTIRP